MRIYLNDPKEFTIENVRRLIASEDDSVNTQFRVTKDGFLFLSRKVGLDDLENIAFRLETNGAGNDYVGKNAAKDDKWVKRVFDVVSQNWPNPTDIYFDDF